ncbi:MAG: MliC family protein [Thermomicrobiales bacterium]
MRRVAGLLLAGACGIAAPAHADSNEILSFHCDDGSAVSIIFVAPVPRGTSAATDVAVLMLPGRKKVEILTQIRMASGIRYQNDTYAYQEWHGASRFFSPATPRGTDCRAVP